MNQCISGCPSGAKMTNLALTYIPEALNNGLSLFTGSKAVKIFRRNGLYTLKIIKNKKILNLYCEKLYISAGPIHQYALIKEYFNDAIFSKVIWMHFEGSDLSDVNNIKNKNLINYFYDENYINNISIYGNW